MAALLVLAFLVFVARRESGHFDAGEHIVFHGDGSDRAAVVGVDEKDAAVVPDGMTAWQPHACPCPWLASIVCRR